MRERTHSPSPKSRLRLAITIGFLLTACPIFSTEINPLKEATFTEIAGEVKMGTEGSTDVQTPKVGDLFTANNFLSTGVDTKVELKASDLTTIRLGSNALFRFGPGGRELALDEGTLLLQAPKGLGGGKIITPTVVAAARGTTFMVTTTRDGGFKCSCLESKVDLKTSSGIHQTITAGQVSFVLPGGKISAPVNIDLARAIKSSAVVSGFSKPVASLPLIQTAVAKQQTQIQSNHLQQTGQILLETAAQNGLPVNSLNTISAAITPRIAGPNNLMALSPQIEPSIKLTTPQITMLGQMGRLTPMDQRSLVTQYITGKITPNFALISKLTPAFFSSLSTSTINQVFLKIPPALRSSFINVVNGASVTNIAVGTYTYQLNASGQLNFAPLARKTP